MWRGSAVLYLTTNIIGVSSRRDDMESLGYVLMYFNRTSLPWQGLKVWKYNSMWIAFIHICLKTYFPLLLLF